MRGTSGAEHSPGAGAGLTVSLALLARTHLDAQQEFSLGFSFGTRYSNQDTVGPVDGDELDLSIALVLILNTFPTAQVGVDRVTRFGADRGSDVRRDLLVSLNRLAQGVKVDLLALLGSHLNIDLGCRGHGDTIEDLLAVELLESGCGHQSDRTAFRPFHGNGPAFSDVAVDFTYIGPFRKVQGGHRHVLGCSGADEQ